MFQLIESVFTDFRQFVESQCFAYHVYQQSSPERIELPNQAADQFFQADAKWGRQEIRNECLYFLIHIGKLIQASQIFICLILKRKVTFRPCGNVRKIADVSISTQRTARSQSTLSLFRLRCAVCLRGARRAKSGATFGLRRNVTVRWRKKAHSTEERANQLELHSQIIFIQTQE